MDFQDIRVKWTRIGDFISLPANRELGAQIAGFYTDCIGIRGSIDWSEEEIRRETDLWQKTQEILPEDLKFTKEEMEFLKNGRWLSTVMAIQFGQRLVHRDFVEIEQKLHEMK